MKSYILTKPLSRSLYEQIREDIITKEIAPHTRLPSKRELASHLKVSLITVEHALDQLEAEGYIEARTRSGTYVLPQPSIKSKVNHLKSSGLKKSRLLRCPTFQVRSGTVLCAMSLPLNRIGCCKITL